MVIRICLIEYEGAAMALLLHKKFQHFLVSQLHFSIKILVNYYKLLAKKSQINLGN